MFRNTQEFSVDINISMSISFVGLAGKLLTFMLHDCCQIVFFDVLLYLWVGDFTDALKKYERHKGNVYICAKILKNLH